MAGGTRIRIVQQGGFAGTVEQVALDSGALAPSAASEVEAARAELLSLAEGASAAEPEIGADLPRYVVEIEGDGATQRFELPDTAGQGAALGGPDIGAIVARLQRLSGS
jgi:emfourin